MLAEGTGAEGHESSRSCGSMSDIRLDTRLEEQVEISGLRLLGEQLFGERLRSLVNFPKSKFPNTKQISQNKGADEAKHDAIAPGHGREGTRV